MGGAVKPDEYFVSLSGGADSTAACLVCKEYGLPITAAVYCEVMFDEYTSAEVPEHRDFMYETLFPRLEGMGIPVIVLRHEKNTAMTNFYHVVKKSKTPSRNGKFRGFPMMGHQGQCSLKRDCKLPPIQKFHKEHPNAIFYEGICVDEPKRIKQDKLDRGCYPLVDYGYTQAMSRELCREHGLLSPIYDFCKRGGCFFCPNASDAELRHLRDHHPDLWGRLLEMQAEPNIVRPGKFRINEGLFDIENRFYLEDAQMNLFEEW